MLAPFAAIFIALFWCLVALLIVGSKGYTPGGIVLCLAGIIAGGVAAYLPGAYALSGWGAIVDPGGEFGHVTTVACAAIFVGALFGLYVAERLRERAFPSTRQIFNAALGFLFGGMGGYVILFFTHGTWAHHLGAFALFPAIVSTAMLAGSAIAHPWPDL